MIVLRLKELVVWEVQVLIKMNEKFNFIIARKWDKNSDHLCVYTMHNKEVHFGTMMGAKNLKKEIELRSNKKYNIYTIDMR